MGKFNYKVGKPVPEGYDTKTTLIIVFIIILCSVLFDWWEPLPDNCHRTPSVDVGGSDIECD